MTEILAGAGVEMLATILLATAFIPVLKSVKMGQKILDIGPRWHKSKEGTPTMGGLFFLVPMVIIGAALAFLKKRADPVGSSRLFACQRRYRLCG